MRDGFEFEVVTAFEPGRAGEILAGIPAAPGVFALFGHGAGDQPFMTRTANLRRRLTRLLMVPEDRPQRLKPQIMQLLDGILRSAQGQALEAVPLTHTEPGNDAEPGISSTDKKSDFAASSESDEDAAGAIAVPTLPANVPAMASRRLNLGGRVARIEYSVTGSEFEAMLLLFKASAALLGMDAAERRLRLGTPYVVRLAVENAYPRAYVTNRISAKALENYYGPFATRTAAERFLDESLNLFKLRRCWEELAPDPAFPGCVYSEMKMCLAPCFKGCSDERYAEETQAVGEYLATRGGSLVREIAAARDAASEGLDFEQAAQLHGAMVKAVAAAHLADEIVRPIARLDAVVVQAGALFLVKGGMIFGPVKLADSAEELVGGALASLEGLAGEAAVAKKSSRVLGCHLAMLKRWYYRGERTRRGEIFFRGEGGGFPMKRIMNAVVRVNDAKDSAGKVFEKRNGVALAPVREGAQPVTSEMVRKLDEELQ